MDLTPKAYRKKPERKRRIRASWHVTRHWKNPFQLAIFGVAFLFFAVFHIIDRAKAGRQFEALMTRVGQLEQELSVVDQQAAAGFANLQELCSGVVSKAASEEESALRGSLSNLNQRVEAGFLEVNESYATMAFRYRARDQVRNHLAGLQRKWIDAALKRNEYELARHCYNASYLKESLEQIKPAVIGEGSLEIIANTNEVYEINVWPHKSDGPRLVPSGHVGRSKTFPYTITGLVPGSYMVFVTRADGSFSPYPVHITHGENRKLVLEIPASIPKGLLFVPGGDFICGGEGSPYYRRHTRSLPSFLIRKYEVTVAEYLEFWKSLSDSRLKEQMMSRVCLADGEEPVAAWDAMGHLADDRLKPGYPVVGISKAAAEAFCVWKGKQVGKTVRLPTAFEWEKAARGVDGRTYPWGYGFEPDARLAHSADNPSGKNKFLLWAPPGLFARDISVYNASDMGGNVREMTSTPVPGKPGPYQVKGGSAFTTAESMRCASVSVGVAGISDLGFRYVQELSSE